jgi:hypothetical protein
MCMPKAPAVPPPPPPPQEVKQPETQALKDSARRNRSAGAMTGGSLLTGPSGIATSAMSTGKTSLLGQ